MIKVFTQHRYLLWQFTKRQIEQRHKGSVLGILWSVLQPLAMMGVYTIVFGLIFRGQYSGIEGQTTMDYALGVFLSITLYQMVAEAIGSASGIIVGQPNLVKKVVFPLAILPLAQFGASLYQFLISLTLVLLGVLFLGEGFSASTLLFPITILPMIPMAIGISLGLSALGVFLRDLQFAAGPITLVMMYSSAVFYSSSMVPPPIWVFLKYNPLVHVLEQSRRVLLWHLPIEWSGLLYSFLFGLATLALGTWLFAKLKPAFADVL